ncbi:MAG: hypothetical protein DUD27_02795 [Lachnospiraceae bacterium]|uniref:Uncharacterized protein n=1 Tax=Candidatus Weimeria bifida TaxID=2599074 RepID=A0A6N7J0E3_9FIRM|nr:hypothetical protein [Candidatus Weimeria bifida]RRF96844.1 MAG: hypothetical protein DUD27_02795 [Lachnospiraceae bacterium]
MKRKRKGSITVFISLSLASVLLLFFLLLDLARIQGQRKKADLISDIAAQSVFADYNRYLWDNYRILGVDASYGTGGGADFSLMESRMQEYLIKNGLSADTKGRDFYQLTTEVCEVSKYVFLTDDSGRAFLKQAAEQQKSEIAADAVKRTKDAIEQIKESRNENGDVEKMVDDGSSAMEKSAKNSETETQGNSEEYTKPGPDEVNPIEQIKEWKNNGILSQVLPSSTKISVKKADLSETVSKRTLSKGSKASEEKLSASEKILFAEYEKSHFSNYRKNLGHDGLNYEWEYVLCGKDSDKDNLASTVSKLLVAREVENYASLMADEGKIAQADTHALTLAGWTGNTAIINAVFWGLTAAWAYTESVLDVRLLLSGGKVSVFKSSDEWTTDNLLELADWFDVNKKAKECGIGIKYEDYLLILSGMQSQKTLGLRSLDLLENSVRMQRDYENLRLDQLVTGADFKYRYSSVPAFFSLFALSDRNFPTMKFEKTKKMTYLTK